MKVEVTKDYVDKHTHQIHRVGDTVEYDPARAQELIDNGVAKKAKKTKKKE